MILPQVSRVPKMMMAVVLIVCCSCTLLHELAADARAVAVDGASHIEARM